MERRPVIFDCDPGVDDAQAMILLSGCGIFDVLGITVVHGNAALENTVRNALFLRDTLKLRCPVVAGADKAMIVRHPRAGDIHGKNGLAGYPVPAGESRLDGRYAWDFIAETARRYPGELELIAVGPLTNIALAVLKYPDVVAQIKRITVMSGGATAGNVTAAAEFNAHQDPHAADIVFKAGFRDLIIVDLDACNSAALRAAEADRLTELDASNPVAPMLATFREHNRTLFTQYLEDGPEKRYYESRYVVCDAVAVAVAACPEIARYVPVAAACECSGSAVGQTVFDGRRWIEPNASLACDVERDEFVKFFFYSINQFDGLEET